MNYLCDYPGYEGNDVSLDISLFEYGLIWKQEETEFKFIYGVRVNDQGEYDGFDWGTIAVDADLYTEFDWANFTAVLECLGLSESEWDDLPLPARVYGLLAYYGYQNIFGDSYTQPIEIGRDL